MHSFRRILRTAGLFVLIVALLSAGFIACYLRGENFNYQDWQERDALRGRIDLLVSGASYTMFGLRPDVLDDYLGSCAYDLSSALITARGRYTLLALELERNPVKTVLLEVSPDTLIRDRAAEGVEGDLPILGKLNSMAARWDYYWSAFSLSEAPEVYYDLVSKGIESALRLLNGTYQTTNPKMIQGFLPVEKPDWWLSDDFENRYHTESLPEEICAENAEYLEQIEALCREHGATLILFSMPQSQLYNCVYDNLDVFQTWYEDFAARHGLVYLNLNLYREKPTLLPDHGCYYDDTHLNATGAQKCSELVGELLRDLAAGEPVADRFWDSYAELDRNCFSFD